MMGERRMDWMGSNYCCCWEWRECNDDDVVDYLMKNLMNLLLTMMKSQKSRRLMESGHCLWCYWGCRWCY